jgi:ribose transport system substrate-binding protein
MKVRTMLLAVLLAAVAALSAIGCGDDDDGGGGGGSKDFKVGSMIWDTSIPFYSKLIKEQKETAKELGVDLDLENGGGDLPAEIAAIQRFVAQDVDLILATPSDAKGIAPAIREANSAGIPVISVNNRVDTETGVEVVTFVGADDVNFGARQAELLVKAIGETGKVAYIQGKLGTSAQIGRKQGFDDHLADYPGIEVVTEKTADWDATKALAVTQDILSKYAKGGLDAIIDQGPEGVGGARWARKNGRDDVSFVLGDYPADVRKAIEDGVVFGTVNQDPGPQGTDSIKLAVDWLKGDKDKVKRPNAYLPLPLVTADNVAKFPPAWGG